MLDGALTWPTVGAGTGWALAIVTIAVVGRALLNGRLITEKQHKRELALKQEQVDRAEHDATEWRTEGRIKDTQIVMLNEVIKVKDTQLDHMGEVGRTAVATLEAVRALASSQAQET